MIVWYKYKCFRPLHAVMAAHQTNEFLTFEKCESRSEVLRDPSALLRKVRGVLDASVPPGLNIADDRLSWHLCSSWWASILGFCTVGVPGVVMVVVILCAAKSTRDLPGRI